MIPGAHRIRRELAGGRVAEYWYAWRGRGAPRILQAEAANEAALDREVARLTPAALDRYKAETGPAPDGRFLSGLIVRYLKEMEGSNLAPATKNDRRKDLGVVREQLGTMEVVAFESRKARSFLLDWRDQWADTPCTADDRLGALAMVLKWAVDRGELAANPLKEFPRLYDGGNRADVIWEPPHLAAVFIQGTEAFNLAVEFLAHSALRGADAVRVPTSAVGEHAIVFQTGKSRGRRTIIVPITEALRDVLDRLEAYRRRVAPDSLTVLNSSWGRPWTFSGIQTAMQRAKTAAIAHHTRKGASAEELRLADTLKDRCVHDLRGTAATHFIRAGLPLDDVATILGWEKTRVEQIALKYVTGEEIALAIVERMKRARTA